MYGHFYEEDILGEGFQRTTLSLRDDYEGSAVATLVRRLVGYGERSVGALYSRFLMIIFFSGKWLVV